MPLSLDDVLTLETLEGRLAVLLPALYRGAYDDVAPSSMGSAALKYDADGLVAWDRIWATFCDLSMAGGPPHRGALLEPATRQQIAAGKQVHADVVREICRGANLVTGLRALESAEPGWIEVECPSADMAGWLMRAIVLENVAACQMEARLLLPAGPAFRVIKEIRNVVTALAKTCHYWSAHMSPEQHQAIGDLLVGMSAGSPLVCPAGVADIEAAPDAYRSAVAELAAEIHSHTPHAVFPHRYNGWIGVECADVRSAVWVVRALVCANVLARREGEAVYLPVSLGSADRERMAQAFLVFLRLSARDR